MNKFSNFRLTLFFVGLISASFFLSCSEEKSESNEKNNSSKPALTIENQKTSEPGTGTINIDLDYQPSNFPNDLNGKAVEVGGIRFTPASQWTDFGPSGMRTASYAYGPLPDEKDSATVTVFYFGTDGGGSIEENLDRWIGQMSLMDGRETNSGKILYELEVNGMKVHILSIYGIYSASMGGPMSQDKEDKYDYRMVCAIVEGPQGNIFFKLTGPDFTARIMIEAFMPMIKSVKKI